MQTRRSSKSRQRDLFGERDEVLEDLRDGEHSRRGKAGQRPDEVLGECPDCGKQITKKTSIESRCGQCFRRRAMGLEPD